VNNFLYPPAQSPVLSQVLHWPDTHQVSTIEDILTGVLNTWFMDWFATDDFTLSVRGIVASEFDLNDSEFTYWYEINDAHKRRAWLGFIDAAEVSIENALPLVSKNSTLSKSRILPVLASKAVEAFYVQLNSIFEVNSFDRHSCIPPKELFALWSGAIVFEAISNSMKCYLVLNSEMVNFLAKPRRKSEKISSVKPELSAVSSAIDSKKIVFPVELLGCELDIYTLQNLQIGDVIRLPHGLDEAVILKTESGDVFSTGYLGRINTKKAIEVVSGNVSSHELKEDSNVK